MKKFFLLLVGLAVTLGVSANVRVKGPHTNRTINKAPVSVKAPSRADMITDQPEGEVVTYGRGGDVLVVSLYGYNVDPQVGQMKVCYAPDGETVYLLDPLAYGEGVGVWVKGTISADGNTISVPVGQYLAYNEEYDYGLVLAWGSTDLMVFEDEEGLFYWMEFYVDETVEAITYAVDASNGTISLVGGAGDASLPVPDNLFVTGAAGVWSDDGSVATVEWNTTWTPLADAVPAVPANPEALDFFDCGSAEDGYTRFDFNIVLKDVDGNPLHSDYVTYSIYTDNDQLFVFDYDTYGPTNGFDTDMTEIPYGYSGYDFYLGRVYFYRTNTGDDPLMTWRIGVQTHYTVDGVRNSSRIMYLNVYPHTGVNDVDSDKAVAAERYYNLDGRQITEPNGIAIKVTTYTDGTTKATKVIK